MEQLIPIASKLQDVLGAIGQNTAIDLPQIVVVGGQSSGKSSVLEAIVGRSFLPRGSGIVTRRPLVLQLYNTLQPGAVYESNLNDDDLQNEIDGEEWGEFLHQPGKRYRDFVSIRTEIVLETERLVGSNRGVDHAPIHLKIFSPRVLALTLVDLPGIAKVPVGDQPANIEEQIREMCLEYISNPNAIILAVTSANQDLANSDALKLAQEIDPLGNRTVGVLTKLDLMDDGTDSSEILMNQVIPLRRGYIGVVNRGQKDVNADLSIREGLKKEEQFFRNHPVYGRDRNLLAKCGTNRLASHLNVMLMHHIRDCLPELKTRISSMATDVQQELDALGNHASSGSSSGGELLRLLSKFSTNFTAVIEGRGGQNDLRGNQSKCNPFMELFGGARISYIFQEIFSASIMGVGAFDGLSDEEIRTTICNAHGTRPSLFVPEASFEILIRRQIARLEQPGIQAVDLVYEELQRIASQAEPGELTRFPILRDRMVEVVGALLKRCMGPTQMMISNLVKMELAYINTSHPDFIGGSRAVAQLMERVGKENEQRRMVPQSIQTGSAAQTPLSASNRYDNYAEDSDDEDSPSAFLSSGYGASGDNDGGIMNFIFKGKPKIKARRSSNVGQSVHLPQVPDTMKQTDAPQTERDQVEMEVIKSLIESYFKIVRKNFCDLVPKTIMYFLVNHVRDAMQNELVGELYREAEVGNLMKEAEDIAQRRQTCEEMNDLLKKAMEIVNEVRDFNTFK